MKKTVSIVLVCVLIAMIFAACGGGTTTGSSTASSSSTASVASSTASSAAPEENAEIVDGKFVEKRSIVVEVYDRNVDGGTPPEDNFYTDFIKEGVLNDLNIEVTFRPVPRWTEVEQINNLLAAGDAPDVCVTYNGPTIRTYANMGAVHNLTPYLEENKDLLPNLWNFLGEEYLYWTKDPKTSETYSIMARVARNARINTFVREDWLAKLNLSEPKNIDEFEAMLYAFKDNAELLLGKDASQMIPMTMGTYVTWNGDPLLRSFVPDQRTDKDKFIYGFDTVLHPGIKEGARKLNEWYNAGLIWQDFALYASGDTTGGNLEKAGYVGVIVGNWDLPYRGGEDGTHNQLKTNVGPEAGYIAIEPFLNDAGVPRKYLSTPSDRQVFLPISNTEPLASLMYIDWITKFENRFFLQFGEEGTNHEKLADGTIKYIAVKGDKTMNSPNNIDYTLTLNGIDVGDDELNIKSLALGYGFVDEKYITRAFDTAMHEAVADKYVNVGEIVAEQGVGPALIEKRDTFMTQAVTAKPDQFDAVFDNGLKDYLSSGAQAIIDERTAKWAEYFGDKTMLD